MKDHDSQLIFEIYYFQVLLLYYIFLMNDYIDDDDDKIMLIFQCNKFFSRMKYFS